MAESGSFEALHVSAEHEVPHEDETNDSLREDEEEEEYDEEERGQSELQRLGELATVEELREDSLKVTTSSAVVLESDRCSGLLVNSGSKTHLEAEKETVGLSNQDVSKSVIVVQGSQVQAEIQHPSSTCRTSLSEPSPTSVTQSLLSAPSPTLPEQIPSLPKVDNPSIPQVDRLPSSEAKPLTVVPPVRTPISDGYNWRKYGQKQVKSPRGSRSYYRCTFSNCCAKKIECSDHSGHVIEIVNKGIHSHDPPRKNICGWENKNSSPAGPCLEKNVIEQAIEAPKDSDSTTLLKESPHETPSVQDRKRKESIGSGGNREIEIKEEHADELQPKQRMKGNVTCSGTILKSGKKPKFVVHAAGDVGISGDGYSWRKYGQKMVKGNTHPRNYYRCTSAGCPVRKHIETAVDNTSAVIITYKGVHDHDMPVPKKRHGPLSAPLVAATTPASMANLQLKKDTVQSQLTPTQWSVGKEGELTSETLDLGGEKEKAMESARTLLSIGFEIKPC
ncbi:hypothetical protein K2173_020989 [Erythroxylum novogranatense]|uniref:WRKY domain-containing protein n=1 Tax=Erythroxylum novogranatense TaxID=1862640 RepID=A0AAV8TPM9_9ROSI|nr:hypothetical protein K2173_020989 [Erythroxylum novogranatense]